MSTSPCLGRLHAPKQPVFSANNGVRYDYGTHGRYDDSQYYYERSYYDDPPPAHPGKVASVMTAVLSGITAAVLGLGALVTNGANGRSWLYDQKAPSSWLSTQTPERQAKATQITEALGNASTIRFRYYQSPGNEAFHEVTPDARLEGKKQLILKRIGELLCTRPEFAEAMTRQIFNVQLYDAHSYEYTGSKEADKNIVGECFSDGQLNFCIRDLDRYLAEEDDGYDPISHELTHRLDISSIQGWVVQPFNGLLPGMSKNEVAAFEAARKVEKEKIKAGTSPMRAYALDNDLEFLGVLVETYFEKPQALYVSNPVLHNVVENFFKQERRAYANTPRESHPGKLMYLLIGSTLLCISAMALASRLPDTIGPQYSGQNDWYGQ